MPIDGRAGPRDAVATHDGCLYCSAPPKRDDQRDHCVEGKIRALYERPALIEDRTELQLGGTEMGVDRFGVRFGQ
jgi:hypothetical protein